jgi:hypothetical protein
MLNRNMETDSARKREVLQKQSWINNVQRIHPEKTLEEVEALWEKIFTDIGPVSNGTIITEGLREDGQRIEPR